MRTLGILLVLLAGHAGAAVFTVDTGAGGHVGACTPAAADCSFADAITAANATAGEDTVAFAIPASDPSHVLPTADSHAYWSIRPTTSLAVTQPLTIDGYTQPGAVPNTNTPAQGGLNGTLVIEIDTGNGQSITAMARVTVRGLVVNDAPTGGEGYGVYLTEAADGSRVEGNYFGTDVTGRIARPLLTGARISSGCCGDPLNDVVVGGLLPAQRNLISASRGDGVYSFGSHVIVGNLIGTDADGMHALGNGGTGIHVDTGCNIPVVVEATIGGIDPAARNVVSGNQNSGIGIIVGGGGCPNTATASVLGNYVGTGVDGSTPIPNANSGIVVAGAYPPPGHPLLIGDGSAAGANVIAYSQRVGPNSGPGVLLGDMRSLRVRNNRYLDNDGLGIDLSSNTHARNPNDAGDADTLGAAPFSSLQNSPRILAYAPGASQLALTYAVDSLPANAAYPLHVEFYRADGDEGSTFIGADTYAVADATLAKSIVLPLPVGVTLGAGDIIVATAEDAAGNMSEFSFDTAALDIEARLCGAPDGDDLLCDGFDGGAARPLHAIARASATSGPFTPNGEVAFSDSRGGACLALLVPTATAGIATASCVLEGSGAPGGIVVNASMPTMRSAFGDASGQDAIASGNFTLP